MLKNRISSRRKKTAIARLAPPQGWRLVPRELINWVTPTWGEKQLEINPLLVTEGRIDLQSGTKVSKKNQQKNATVITYRAALTTAPTSDLKQKMLSVFDLRVLSELIHIMHSQEKSPDDLLLFKASKLISGLGLALAGSSYARVEQSLADLASFRVETSIDHQGSSDYLLNFAETGRISILSGASSFSTNDHLAEKPTKRHLFWRVQMGNLMRLLLRYESLFTSYPLSVYKEAGRSPTAQWLTFFYFSHGHNGSAIYEHKLTTLAEKTNLPAQITQRLTAAIEREYLSKSKDAKSEDALDRQGKIERVQQKSLRLAAVRIRNNLQKIINTGIFSRLNILNPENDDDPMQGKVQARRYQTKVEMFLSNRLTARNWAPS